MKKLIDEFKKFIKRGNVVDMAVGVAVASAFTAIVTAFTNGFISPLLALITGESSLDQMKWVIREKAMEGETVISQEVAILWGPVVHAIINFFIIALALFIVLKVYSALRARAEKLNKSARNLFTKEDDKAAAEAAAKAEEEKRLAEEAAAAEAAAKAEAERIEAEKIAAEKARLERQEQLLTDIRDLLKSQNNS